MAVEEIRNWIMVHRESILETNKRLVGIPSENQYPYGSELLVQLEINRQLQQLGFKTDVFLPTDVPDLKMHEAFLDDGRNYQNRPNVVGVLKGSGEGKSLLFSGHMDTVPKGSDTWTQDPYAGEVVGDVQFGLGILDMKSGMVAAMMAVKCLRDLDYRIKGDVIIESVVDEEYGGANGTLACRLRGYRADAAIIPEPSNLAICPAAQGGSYFRITFQGRPGRSYSGEKTVNPIFAAARFLEIIRQYHEWRNKHANVHPLYMNNPELPTLVQVLRAGDVNLELGDRVPSSCSFDVWIQCYPGVTEEELYTEFTGFFQPLVEQDEILSAIPPVIEKKVRFLPGTGLPEDHPILGVLQDAGTESVPGGLPIQGAPFACDSFMFNRYSTTPAVIFGPSGGNAHAPDEFIHIPDFLKLIEIYALTILKWCEADKKP